MVLVILQELGRPSLNVCKAIAASSTSNDAWPDALQKV